MPLCATSGAVNLYRHPSLLRDGKVHDYPDSLRGSTVSLHFSSTSINSVGEQSGDDSTRSHGSLKKWVSASLRHVIGMQLCMSHRATQQDNNTASTKTTTNNNIDKNYNNYNNSTVIVQCLGISLHQSTMVGFCRHFKSPHAFH